MSNKNFFIAIEGNIGAGKTTLAKAIARLVQGHLLLERFEENPFLTDFYKDKKKWAFDTELFFLKDRINQLNAVEAKEGIIISDFCLLKSKLFAGITLKNNSLNEFTTNYIEGLQKVRQPDLILYLTNDINALKNSIDLRGRPYENQIRKDYLNRIEKAYQKAFSEINDIPVIFLDKSKLNYPYENEELLKIFNFCLFTEHKGVTEYSVSYF